MQKPPLLGTIFLLVWLLTGAGLQADSATFRFEINSREVGSLVISRSYGQVDSHFTIHADTPNYPHPRTGGSHTIPLLLWASMPSSVNLETAISSNTIHTGWKRNVSDDSYHYFASGRNLHIQDLLGERHNAPVKLIHSRQMPGIIEHFLSVSSPSAAYFNYRNVELFDLSLYKDPVTVFITTSFWTLDTEGQILKGESLILTVYSGLALYGAYYSDKFLQT